MRSILIHALYVSLVAGILATLPFAILFSYGMDASLALFAGTRYFGFGIGCSLLIGLPVSLAVFQIIKRDPDFSFGDLMLVANGAAIILATLLGLFSGWFAVIFFGIPTILAANVYAILGWRKILGPYQAEQNA
ncbi:hypothetical protein [Qipengyuania sp.]|uniref:hypothetical protein n=2 Tax=Qipengyuania sp. TaxID=2004515 RepID=UPI003559867B